MKAFFGGSLLLIDRISDRRMSRVLNHAEAGVTAVYERHTYDDESAERSTRGQRMS